MGNPHEDRKIPTKTVVNCLAVFWGVTAMHHGLILAKAFTYPQWQPALEAAPWRSAAKRGKANCWEKIVQIKKSFVIFTAIIVC